MRRFVAVVVPGLPVLVSCSVLSLLSGDPLPCTDDASCPATAPFCVDFECRNVGDDEGDIVGEGEGDVVGEGEGDVVGEGEGDVVGEGEGDVVVVGEGEGDVVVGEGEGDVVVGEGEGEGDVATEFAAGFCPDFVEEFPDPNTPNVTVTPTGGWSVTIGNGGVTVDVPDATGGAFGVIDRAVPRPFSLQMTMRADGLPLSSGQQDSVLLVDPAGKLALTLLAAGGSIEARLDDGQQTDSVNARLTGAAPAEQITLAIDVGTSTLTATHLRWRVITGAGEFVLRDAIVPSAVIDLSGAFATRFAVQNFGVPMSSPTQVIESVALQRRCP